MSKLTRADVDVLISALEFWENKHLLGSMMGTVFSAIMARSEQEGEALFARQKERDTKDEVEKAQRHERRVLLEAKLIELKTQLAIDEVTA